MKLLLSTDVHGSETCFRKFLNALKVYNVEVGILLGDLLGKMINPIVKQPDGTHICNFFGEKTCKTEEELRVLEKKIASTGNYYFYTTPEEMKKLEAEGKTVKGRIDERAAKIHLVKGKIEDLFQQLAAERMKNWIKLAEERLGDSNIKMFMAPGNDDFLEIDEILDSSTYVVNADNKKVDVNGYEMISLSWSNPTPWDTPRECSEEELERKIDKLASQIEDMESAIFNFHVPPHGTVLDEAPALSKDLVPSLGKTISAGSKAILNSIKKYQPLLGLHGHIHESRGVQKIGRTVCLNPGSEYTEGILRGVIIRLDKKKVKDYMFTSG